MTKISQYPEISTPDIEDLLIGTDIENSNATKNFTIGSIVDLANETINAADYVKNTEDIFLPTPKITQIVTLSSAQYTSTVKVASTMYIII